MKLFYTGNSPYARRPRIAFREAGLSDRVEEVLVGPLGTPDHELLKYGPGAKVPGLLTDGGLYLCESLIITRYMDEVSGGKLYPKEQAARELSLHVEGIASMLMDSLFVRSHENRREPGEKSPGVIEKESIRARRCYDALEALAERAGKSIDMGAITVVASLGYADWRHPGDNWRGGRAKLTRWFDQLMERPAMAETKPVF